MFALRIDGCIIRCWHKRHMINGFCTELAVYMKNNESLTYFQTNCKMIQKESIECLPLNYKLASYEDGSYMLCT